MFTVVTIGWQLFEKLVEPVSKKIQLIELLYLLFLGVGTYVVMALALKMEELKSILAVFKRKFKKS